MKASELKEKSVDELNELAKTLGGELFQSRLRNYTNQLDDTAALRRNRRDVARVKGELRRRELESLAQQVRQALASQTQESK